MRPNRRWKRIPVPSINKPGYARFFYAWVRRIDLKRPFVEDRSLLQRRVVKGFEAAASLPHVDADQIAVLGMGFGGGCAIDLARSGVNLKGAISIYGHFAPPPAPLIKLIKAKVLILHVYKDPVAD